MNKEILTIEEAHEKLSKKKISAVELTSQYIDTIKKKNRDLNAYITVLEDDALAQAKELDKKGKFSHALSGIPLAIKDVISIQGTKTTAGSKILENYFAPFDATVIKKLKSCGSVFLGKTNMDEFACGSSSETSYFGPVKNPYDQTRVPGGSSGGSAAAVASDMCLGALGTDTGGSIRQPASLCGIVGLKPTYGRVSRYGLLAMASSLDQIGPFAKNVRDCALLYEAIAGNDPYDATSSDRPTGNILKDMEKDIKGLRIGVPKEYIDLHAKTVGLEEGVREKVIEAIKKLEARGAKIDDSISLPHMKYALPVYYILMPSELSSNLEKFDGQKYGYSDRSGKNLMDIYCDSRGAGFGDEIRRRIMVGTYTLSAGYYDAYYRRSLKVRTLIINDFKKAFEKVDVLVTPTSPTVAFKLGEKTSDPLSMYLADIYTVSANIAGIPGISVPCGMANPKDGNIPLPVGVQIMGKHFDENMILRTAYHLEQI